MYVVNGKFQQARELNRETVKRYSKTFGEEDEGRLHAMWAVGTDLRVSGRFAEALELDRRALRTARRAFGDDGPACLSGAHKRGRRPPAARTVQRSPRTGQHNLADTRLLGEQLGAAHPLTLTCATNLAGILSDRGENEAAYELDVDTLTRFERTLGGDHPATLACGVNMALDLRALDRLDEAEAVGAGRPVRPHDP